MRPQIYKIRPKPFLHKHKKVSCLILHNKRNMFSWVAFSGALILNLLGGLFSRWTDPYYEMEAHNLNTMNSYFIPANAIPLNESGIVDVADYVTVTQDLNDPTKILSNADSEVNNTSVIHFMSSYVGVWIQILLLVMIGLMLKYKPDTGFSQTFAYAYEWLFDFFETILWQEAKLWIKKFVVALFFIIVIANGFARFSDIIRFAFPRWLRNVTAGTAELEFNVALAIIGSVMILAVQRKTVGGWLKLLHEYVPITGKWLMENKVMDIIISMFMWILDIVGFFARIISLSLRLFGNMSAGSILLNVAYLGLSAVTISLISLNIPIGIPLIVYLQWVLSVLIQAFVFTLIVAIGIRMAS